MLFPQNNFSKIKHDVDGIEKHTASFVARGFSEKEGIDCEETFALVAHYTSVTAIIAIRAAKGWKIQQMDVKTTFPNETIEEVVYLEQPEGFVIHNVDSHVCKLKKVLYGLKQAPRAWYERIDPYLLGLGFSKNDADPNLYFKVINGDMLILILYVDDLLIAREDHLITQCKDLASEFDMKDLGILHYFLGLEVWQKSNGITLNQGKYTIDILKRFGMLDRRPISITTENNLHKLEGVAAKYTDNWIIDVLG